MNLGNNVKRSRMAAALWLVALVPLGFSQSFPDRPTADDMTNIVALGTECIRGLNERCWATQTGTNPVTGAPVYAVDPPFIQTNATGWYLDTNAMGTIAFTIKALVPYYVDTNSVSNGSPNIVMLTVTGLWARLEIGDHMTNFTAIPAIGTNPPTYGNCPGRIYVADLQERYKVLNALTTTKGRGTSYNGSDFYRPYGVGNSCEDFFGYKFSNTVSHVISDVSYAFNYFYEKELDGFQAYVLGLPNAYYLTNNWVLLPDTQVTYDTTWAQQKTMNSWWYFHYEMIYPAQPPWTPYPGGFTLDTNGVGMGAGSWRTAFRDPIEGVEAGTGTGDYQADMWAWEADIRITFSTWKFYAYYPGQQISNTWSILIKPTLPPYETHTNVSEWIEGGTSWPRSWTVDAVGQFEEFAGMTRDVFSELDKDFVKESGGVLTVEFGSDQFPSLTAAGSEPPYPDEPTTSSGFNNFTLNTGSVGTMRGLYLNPEDYCFLKTWQFNYCTNKWW